MTNETATSQTKLTTKRGYSYVVNVLFRYGPNNTKLYSMPDSVHANYESAHNRRDTIRLANKYSVELEGGVFGPNAESVENIADVSIYTVRKMNLV